MERANGRKMADYSNSSSLQEYVVSDTLLAGGARRPPDAMSTAAGKMKYVIVTPLSTMGYTSVASVFRSTVALLT